MYSDSHCSSMYTDIFIHTQFIHDDQDKQKEEWIERKLDFFFLRKSESVKSEKWQENVHGKEERDAENKSTDDELMYIAVIFHTISTILKNES